MYPTGQPFICKRIPTVYSVGVNAIKVTEFIYNYSLFQQILGEENSSIDNLDDQNPNLVINHLYDKHLKGLFFRFF